MPRIGLCADSSEPGACFRFYVSLSLCPSPTCALSPTVSKINKHKEREKLETKSESIRKFKVDVEVGETFFHLGGVEFKAFLHSHLEPKLE